MNEFTVHGREALRLPVISDTMDLSIRTLMFEISGTSIRVSLDLDPDMPTGRIIHLTREQVALLPTVPTMFAVVDETDADPVVLLAGTLKRTGFTR